MLAIGCDHAGFQLKQYIMKCLDEEGVEYRDFGALSEERCDYPVYAGEVCRAVVSGECEKGILICGTGVGMSIAANKIHGIRAALCSDCYSAEFTRRHNDANVLALGARTVGSGLAMRIVDTFLSAPFDGGYHARRVEMLHKLETSPFS